jgi:hypothetical protein
MKILPLLLIGITITLLTITSCKKDRITPPEDPINEYNDLNNYLDTKKQTEQDFEILGPSNDTIVGNQGSRIYGGINCLQDANGDTIDYPFTVHLVELYTPKDMIYWQMPTVASGNILETDGEIRIRATKNGQDLALSCPFTFEMPNATPDTNMTLFSGTDNGSFVNWANTGTSFVIENYSANGFTYGYKGSISSFGWINADLQVGNGSGNTLTFTSETDLLTNVGIFIYFPATKTVMQVYNETSNLIPNGSAVQVILMAQDANGTIFSYTETRTISSSATIDVTLTETSDASLTAYLDGL